MQKLSFLGVPEVLRSLYGGAVWEYQTDTKEIFLTFDDGPSPDVTLKTLDILAKFGAKATFFCIGRNVERHPEIYRAVLDAGHATGNHSYSHVKGWYMPNKDYYRDIKLASGFIQSPLFRPPYGLLTPLQSRVLQKDYRIIMWSVLSVDYDSSIPAGVSFDHVISKCRPGSVVVFHDSVKAAKKMLQILPGVLEHFSALGYSFPCIDN